MSEVIRCEDPTCARLAFMLLTTDATPSESSYHACSVHWANTAAQAVSQGVVVTLSEIGLRRPNKVEPDPLRERALSEALRVAHDLEDDKRTLARAEKFYKFLKGEKGEKDE